MEIEYGLDEKVPFLKSAVYGLQWAAILIPSIIILGRVLGELQAAQHVDQTVYLQKLLFLSALILFGQIFWGHRLPLIPGPAAVLLIGVISSQGFGESVIYTSVIIGGLCITLLAASGLLKYLQRLFTSNVVAVVLLLIAFTLTPTIRDLLIGGNSGESPFHHLVFALTMILSMFLFYRLLKGMWRSTLIIWAMILGSFLYFLIFPAAVGEDLFSNTVRFNVFFKQMNIHWSFNAGVIISFIFCFVALSINDVSSIQAVNELLHPNEPDKRINRGMLITGIGNIMAGLLAVIGPVNYSLSPGVITATGCASRFTLVPAAAVILLLAFSPAGTGFVGSVPSVVIGAVLVYVMASQVAAGLMVALNDSKEKAFPFESGLKIGLPILLGVIIAFLPERAVQSLPPFLRPILGNGFVTGVLSAFILEHVLLGRGKIRID